METTELQLITDSLYELKKAKAELDFNKKQIEKDIELYELKLVGLLNNKGVDFMSFNGFDFGFKETSRTAFDQKLFEANYPDLYKEHKITKISQKFEFKINKPVD